MHRFALSLLAISSVATTAAGDQTLIEDANVAELRALVADLQEQVQMLKAQGSANWLTQQRAAEIRSLVQDVLADADTRANLLQGGMTAGYDRGFFLASADGNYRLNISGRLQFRYVYNNQDNSDDDNRWGFEMRRTRLQFAGHVINPNWTYQIQGDFNRDGGGFTLLDGVIGHKFENGMTVRVGQFKAPFNREELVSSSRQLAVDRSLVNSRFNVGRAQGIELAAQLGENIRVAGMISDGARSLNTPWQAYDTEFAITGRVDFLAAGNFQQFADFSSWDGEEFGLLIGAAAHYQKDEYGTVAGPEVEDFRWTIDGSAKFGNFSLFAAVIGRHLSADNAADADQYGIVVQGGLFIVPNEWEIFARYEWGDDDTSSEDLSVLTGGVTRYWAKHNLKWTTDVGYGLNQVSSGWASSSLGWRADPAGEDGQLVVRSQLQLAF